MIALISYVNITIEGLIHPKNESSDPTGLTTCSGTDQHDKIVQPFVNDLDEVNYDYLEPAGLLLSQDAFINNMNQSLTNVPALLSSSFTSSLVALS